MFDSLCRDERPVLELAESEVVRRLRLGDSIAFEVVMRRNNQRLFRIARGILKNDADAEDVVQESYILAFTKLDQLDDPRRLPGWLARIAVNAALAKRRQNLRRTGVIDTIGVSGMGFEQGGPSGLRCEAPDPERKAASSELRHALETAIDDLPDGFREVFMMRVVEGMSISETADCLDLRPETVKTRLHRARGQLQDALSAHVDTLSDNAFAFAGSRCDRIVEGVLRRLGLFR